MNKSEELLIKNINLLPGHLSKHQSIWKEQLKEISALLQILSYQSEEIVHTHSVEDLKIANFEELHNKLCMVLEDEINDTLEKILRKINDLKSANNDMKNRIDALEKLSAESYNYLSSKVINGNEKQPSLSVLFECCLKYRMFFLNTLNQIIEKFNNVDVKSRESVTEFKECFYIDLNNLDATLLISLLQYLT